MSRPPARAPSDGAPYAHEPHDRALKDRVPTICELNVCEPLVATLVLLIALLTYGQGVPAPFVPVPRPASGVTAGARTPMQSVAAPPALTFTPMPTTGPSTGSPIKPPLLPMAPAAQPTSTSSSDLQASATPVPTPAPVDVATATETPARTLTGEPTPTREPTPTQEPTPADEPTLAPTAEPTLTSTAEPTPTTAPSDWDLARNIIGLWEHVDPERQYYFDFLADYAASPLVIVAQNGARTYGIEGERTIVIQMPGDPWTLTVRDLSGDRLILEGVFGESDEFYRKDGVPDLEQTLIGLWTDPNEERYPLEFTPNGIALGEFGRGTYRLASDSHLLIDCADPAACSSFRDYGQSEDAPLVLRVYEIIENRMTVWGLRSTEQWTLERFDAHSRSSVGQRGTPMLGADIVGQWEDEDGSVLEFTGAGELLSDGEVAGSYEVLSETTLWITVDGLEEAWVVTELDAYRMAYFKMDLYREPPRSYSRLE